MSAIFLVKISIAQVSCVCDVWVCFFEFANPQQSRLHKVSNPTKVGKSKTGLYVQNFIKIQIDGTSIWVLPQWEVDPVNETEFG